MDNIQRTDATVEIGMQCMLIVAIASVAAHRVLANVLATTIVRRALVYVCRLENKRELSYVWLNIIEHSVM